MILIALALSAISPIIATPATFAAVMDKAISGQWIDLAPGNYGDVRLADYTKPRPTLSPPITVNSCGRSAIFSSLFIYAWNGINFNCFHAIAPLTAQGGLVIQSSDHINVFDAVVVGGVLGIRIDHSHHITVTGAKLSGFGADGMDVTDVQETRLDGIECSDPKTLSGMHPDCVQMWATNSPLNHVWITRSLAVGKMQGFDNFSSTDQTMYDVHFEDNRVISTEPNAYWMNPDCKEGCTFKRNTAKDYGGPDQRWPTRVAAPRTTPRGWAPGSVTGNLENGVTPH